MTKEWIVYPGVADSSNLRLFCFPYSGAGPNIYYPWAKVLHPDIEIASIQLPGHGTRLREQPFEDFDLLVRSLCDALRLHLDEPYAFFGHSLGALLCFEIARQLQKMGLPRPQHIFVSGRHAPHTKPRWKSLQNLGDTEFVEIVRQLKGTPDAVLDNEELLKIFLPALRADFILSERYVYKDERQLPLTAPISAFGGLEDKWVNTEELEGWKKHTRAEFRLYQFPGNHFFLHSSQVELVDIIRSELQIPPPLFSD